MISIIVSSYNKSQFEQFSKNVDDTIGLPYEIIAIDNPGLMGICEAYNKGADQARFGILIFMHEDLIFLTNHWGQNIIDLFKLKNSGVIGVAGSVYKTKMVSGWGQETVNGVDYSRCNLVQHFKFSKQEPIHAYKNPNGEKYSRVVSVDGVFMAVRKEVFKEIGFDESIKGFHAYDLDFSLAVGNKYQNIVTYDILINHFSEGKFNQEWLYEHIKVNQKFFKTLPRSSVKADATITKKIEFANLKWFIYAIKRYRTSRKEQLKLLFEISKTYFLYKPSFGIAYHILRSLL